MGVSRVTGPPDVVVAVDGGGSKTDVAVARLDTGDVLARHRGPGCSQHDLGPDRAVEVVDAAVRAALVAADVEVDRVVHTGCYLTAIDLPDEQRMMHRLLARKVWARRFVTVDNDLFALLRAGTDAPDAAVVVCGTGINGLARRADGTVARLVALGHCSGDWGGGAELGEHVLWFAARAEDGRGEPTELREAVLRWAGASTIDEVSVAVHRGLLDPADWSRHVPEVFALAAGGDAVARRIIERQGVEIGAMAAALLQRVDLQESAVPVVVGGGIGSCGDPTLTAAMATALAAGAPLARLEVTTRSPIDGAVALALAAVP